MIKTYGIHPSLLFLQTKKVNICRVFFKYFAHNINYPLLELFAYLLHNKARSRIYILPLRGVEGCKCFRVDHRAWGVCVCVMADQAL